jgi:hypothetical protein
LDVKISNAEHMSILTQKLDCFGLFEITYLMIDHQNYTQMLSSLNYRSSGDCNFIFSDRFFHFLKLIPENSSKFYSEKIDLFKQSPFVTPKFYVAFIQKKSTKKINIYVFHSHHRSDVVHLLLHKEVLKRMALYMDECIFISMRSYASQDFSVLFKDAMTLSSSSTFNKDYIKETLEILLTKKEKQLVMDYLQYRSVSQVTDHVGFSRAYVTQLLLSAAHKLGLNRVPDILTLDRPNNVLLHTPDQ